MSRKRLTFDDAVTLARTRGGGLESKRFLTAKHRYRWSCEKGHVWRATFDSVRRGSWCPRCAGKKVDKRSRMTRLRQVAKKNGGRVLARSCATGNSKLVFECRKGHQFESDYEHVVGQFTWCPYCRNHIGEEVTRSVMEVLTGHRFVRRHPKWLISDRGRRMQLDGYCEELRLAFEYQGVQHTKEVPRFFHRDRRFKDQLSRDRLKRSLCKENGVTLIEIQSTRQFRNLPTQIAVCLRENGVRLVVDPSSVDVLAIGVDPDASAAATFRSEVVARGGRILSSKWRGTKEPVRIECRNGHLFEQSPKRVSQGRWCRQCAVDSLCLGMEAVRALAQAVNATCVAGTYRNVETPMEMRCNACSCVWLGTPASLKRGTGCPRCAGRFNGGRIRRNLAEMRRIAKERGGQCLSSEYHNAHTVMRWSCAKGHSWDASANNVIRGTWCPTCSKSDRSRAVRASLAKKRDRSKLA